MSQSDERLQKALALIRDMIAQSEGQVTQAEAGVRAAEASLVEAKEKLATQQRAHAVFAELRVP